MSPGIHVLILLKKCTLLVFGGENFHEFRSFVAIHESFLRESLGVASFGTAKASSL